MLHEAGAVISARKCFSLNNIEPSDYLVGGRGKGSLTLPS